MSLFRVGLFAAGLGIVLMGCPSSPATDGGATGGGGAEGDCFEDDDCPDKQFYFCNTTTSKCEPACHNKDECKASVRGEANKLDFCEGGLGCQCDEGKCVGSLCGSDSDCGSQVCRNGACQDAPMASTVTRCTVTPDYAVLKPGSTQKFSVEAYNGDEPVVLKTGVTWSAMGNNVTLTGAADGASAVFTAAANAAALTDGPKVTIGTVSCTAKVEVLDGTVGAGELAVVVTDELTGRGVTGATIIATDNAGVTVGNTQTTTANGYAKLTGITGTEVNVTAFSADYNYLTIANYDYAGGSKFLSFVVRRHQTDKYGGQKGTFTGVPATSNVHAALSGMSIAGSITDLSLAQLLGNTIPTRVKIGNAIDQADVPLPAGVYLGFSDQGIKTAVSAQGLAGVCGGAGAEVKIAAGTCGTRSGWGLSGDVPLGDLPIDAFAGGTTNLDFGKILSRILPIFKKFNSSIVRDVEFSLKDTPKNGTTGAPDFTNISTTEYTTKDHSFVPPGAVPLAFNFVNRVPTLPKFKNTFVDGVVLLGGANVPGRGVIPLGLGVAVNTMPADGLTDKQADLSAPGLVTLRMAPTHHGVEGTEYGVLALGVSFKSFSDSSAGVATSGLFGHPKNNKLEFDPTGTTDKILDLPTPFPVMPEGAKYNFSDADAPGLTKRTFKVVGFDTSATTNPVTAVRVAFTDGVEHRWVVLADPAKVGTSGFTLPKPPGTTVDRTFANGMTTGTRSTMLVQTLRLSETPTAATVPLMGYKALVEANGTNADRMTDFTVGFSFIDYARPTIAWKTPTAAGTIAHGGTAVVTVKNFKVPDDGSVKLTFTGGAGCTDVPGNTDTSMGKGEINLTIPAACMGAVTMTASLVDAGGMALNPPVSAAISATVN